MQQIGGTHYEQLAYQPVQFICKLRLNYFEGNVIKYVTRYKYKNGVEDLQKALHYLHLEDELKPISYRGSFDDDDIDEIGKYVVENELDDRVYWIIYHVCTHAFKSAENEILELIMEEL